MESASGRMLACGVTDEVRLALVRGRRSRTRLTEMGGTRIITSARLFGLSRIFREAGSRLSEFTSGVGILLPIALCGQKSSYA